MEITSEVHSCASLMRQLEPHSLLHWLTEHKLLGKCEASGFLFYFKVVVGNLSKKSRLGLTVFSLLGKMLRKEAHQYMYLVVRDGHNGMRSFTLGAVLNDRGSPELEHSAVCDVPAMGWAWLELLQSLGYSCDWGIVLQASGKEQPAWWNSGSKPAACEKPQSCSKLLKAARK